MLDTVTWNGLIPAIGWIERATVVLNVGAGSSRASKMTVESRRNEKGCRFQMPLVLAISLKLGVTVAPSVRFLETSIGGSGI